MSYKKWLKLFTMTVAVIGLVATVGLAGGTNDPIKWSQPPVEVDEGTGWIYGWDEPSMTGLQGPLVADDFLCNDPRPVTDLHWWGSYPGVDAGVTPRHPDRFVIKFWNDVPVGADPGYPDVYYSHPKGPPLHTIVSARYQWEDTGMYDIDVLEYDANGVIIPVDRMYQYNLKFDRDQYFPQQPDNIYWISIQAEYNDPTTEDVWGWKTRPKFFMDDAVRGFPPAAGGGMMWEPIERLGKSWDTAFELTVPEPSSFVLLGIGAVGFVACAWRKRRRG